MKNQTIHLEGHVIGYSSTNRAWDSGSSATGRFKLQMAKLAPSLSGFLAGMLLSSALRPATSGLQ